MSRHPHRASGRTGTRVALLVLGLAIVPLLWTAGAPGAASAQDAPAAAESPAEHPAQSPAQNPAQDPEPEPSEPELYDDSLVREIRLTFGSAADRDAVLRCGRRRVEEQDVEATLEVDGTVRERIGVRCKGNSTRSVSNDKKPMNLTIDAFVDGQDLWGYDVVNLSNNWNDPSQLREAMAMRMLSDYMPVPRHTFARVFANGKYLGMYLVMEQVNAEWAEHWHDESEGMVVRGDGQEISFDSSPLVWEGEDLDAYREGYEVKGRAAGRDEGYELLREMIRALDAPESAGGLSDADFEAGIRQQLDVDSALWYLAGTNVLANWDSYYVGKNYYLYRGERDPRFHLVPWDFSLSFGLFRYMSAEGGFPGFPGVPGGDEETIYGGPFLQEEAPNRPLIRRLLAQPSFRADYLAHYGALVRGAFRQDSAEEIGTTYQDLVRDAVREEERAQGSIAGSYTFAQFEQNLRSDLQVVGRFGPQNVPGVLSVVAARGTHLDGLPELAPVDLRLAEHARSPEAPTAADEVVVQARFEGGAAMDAVELRYRVRGGLEIGLPMMADGQGGWRATIPAQREGREVSYALRVGTADGRAVFFPAANLVAPYRYEVAGVELPRAEPGALVINELMADNETIIQDPAGDAEDWVELLNRGADPVSLEGLFLSDDPADPWAFALPARTLAPGERLLLWADGDPDEGPEHAPFRLDKDGEAVSLASRDAILDEVAYEEMATDWSLARVPDGSGAFQDCGSPTPGEANACAEAPEPSPTPAASAVPSPTALPSPGATLPPPGPTAAPDARRVYLPVLRRD